MRRVSTRSLMPGMVTAEDVISYSNSLILSKGTVLTDKAIMKLEVYSIFSVRIEDEWAEVPEEEPAEEPEKEPEKESSYSERLKQTPEFQHFAEDFHKETETFKNTINGALDDITNLDVDQLIQNSLALLSTDNKHVNVFDMLHNMRQLDDSTYVHCMNVGLMCNVFAHWLRMEEDDIKTATLCGLLHDIGKLKMPEDILKKPAKLTDEEYEVIKTHPREGFNLLQQSPVDEHVKNAALMHHERCDGTGYPLRLTAAQIDPFAKLVSIADVYDAMTSARVYRGPLCPFKVIEAFEQEGFQKYDAQYILTFLGNIVNTYMLHRVRLSNGQEGEIVFVNQDKLSKPIVKVGSQYVNLANERNLSIEAII